MSAQIEKSFLDNSENSKIVKKHLFIKKISTNSKFNSTEILKSFISDDRYYYVPLGFYSSLMKKHPNIDSDFQKIEMKFTGILREYQIEPTEEALKYIKSYGMCLFDVCTAFGKTIVSSFMVCELSILTVVLISIKSLIIQWCKTFSDFTNASVWDCSKSDKNKPENFNVIICMIGSIHKIPDDIISKVGFVIVDEAHTFCTQNRVNKLLKFHPKYILLETATPKRSDGLHEFLNIMCVNKNIYVPPFKKFEVIKVMTGIKPDRVFSKEGNLLWPELLNNTLLCEERDLIIYKIVSDNIKNSKILILTRLVKHIENLRKLFDTKLVNYEFLSKNKSSYNDTSLLIGTTNKMGIGFDAANNCVDYSGIPFDILILAVSIKEETPLIQAIGRVFRSDDPKIYHLIDNDLVFSRHWSTNLKVYKKMKAKITITK